MQAVVRTVAKLLVGAAVAACHTSGSATPDGSTDGSTLPNGLSVLWTTKTPIPGEVKSDLTVTNMLFRVQNLRVIGDAGPGDTRTSKDTFQLAWSDASKPSTLVFGDAPSGLYSKLVVLADGNLIDYSYEIDGSVRVSDTTYQFKIHDRSPLAVSLDTQCNLDPGKGAGLEVTLDLQQALDSLDWQSIHNDDGVLELDTFDSQMSNFRDKMMDAVFTVTTTSVE